MLGLDIFKLPASFLPLAGASKPSKVPSEEDGCRYPKRKRVEVQYFASDDADNSTDSETECIPIKRAKTTRSKKPLQPQKIFPFTSLPAELRNRIYELCFPDMPTIAEEAKGEQGTIWFRSKQRAYRRSIEQFIPNEEELQQMEDGVPHRRNQFIRRGTGRGRPVPVPVQNNDDEEDDEEIPGKAADKRLGMNILALNQALYSEAAPMVYRQRLVFADTVALMAFASLLSPRTAKLIRHIEVRDWNLTRSRKSMGFIAMSMLAAKGVTNLEKLHINCTIGYFRSYRRTEQEATSVSKRVARKIYRDCFLWLETVGRAKLLEGESRWAGIDVLDVNEDNFEQYFSSTDALEEGKTTFKKELKRLLRPVLG